jgi:hypothetical protein
MASAATERPARRTPFQRHDPVKRHIGGTRLRTHGGAPSPCQHVSRPPRLLSSLSSRCRMSAGSPAFEPLPEPVVVTCLGGPSRANVPYASHPPPPPSPGAGVKRTSTTSNQYSRGPTSRGTSSGGFTGRSLSPATSSVRGPKIFHSRLGSSTVAVSRSVSTRCTKPYALPTLEP